MGNEIRRHIFVLRVLCGAILASTAVYGAIVKLARFPGPPPLAQAGHLLWVLALVAVVNLVTLLPVYRAMLATPRRIFAHSQDLAGLLGAHLRAHLVAYARLDALGVLGLVLFFLTRRADWFWIFNGVAILGMLVLWPVALKVAALVGTPTATGPLEST